MTVEEAVDDEEVQSFEQRLANVVVIFPILILGFIGNSALALVFLTDQKRSHHFKWNAYLLALAIFDLIFLSSTALPNGLQNLFGFEEFGDAWLVTLSCISYASSVSSTLVKMLFCIEQLLNIYRPYRLFNQTSFTQPIFEIAFAAGLSTFHSVIWIVNTPVPTDHHERREITVKRCNLSPESTFELLCLSDFYLFFTVPFLVIAVASALIAHRIVRIGLDENLFLGVRETTLRIKRSSPGGSEIATRVTERLKNLPIVNDLQNATRLMLASSGIFLVSALPFRLFSHIHAAVFHDGHGGEADEVIESSALLSAYLERLFCWIWYSNSAFCPVGFYILSKRFRGSVSSRFRVLFWCLVRISNRVCCNENDKVIRNNSTRFHKNTRHLLLTATIPEEEDEGAGDVGNSEANNKNIGDPASAARQHKKMCERVIKQNKMQKHRRLPTVNAITLVDFPGQIVTSPSSTSTIYWV